MQTLTRERFESGLTYAEYCQSVEKHQGLWNGVYEHTTIPGDAALRLHELPGRRLVAVLAEDWCGDAVHVLPYLARLEEAFSHFRLRILSRDENPDLMASHLTNGTCSIPVVMILDEDFQEVAWWGPRPGPLQALFLAEIRDLPREERFPRIRAWFARDRGRTTLTEILQSIPVRV